MARARCRIVVGLGNPGPEYDGTRHNVGFELVDRIAARLGRPFLLRGRSLVARGEIDEIPYVLAKPQTYMNRSGRAVRDLIDDADARVDLIVCYDDFHLPLGRLRCRVKGSDGGQKGMASILAMIGERDVPRLRLGIGEPPRTVPAEEFVLRPFKRAEREEVDVMLDLGAVLVQDWLVDGDLDRLMNAANRRAED